MEVAFFPILFYSLIPAGAALLGGIIGSFAQLKRTRVLSHLVSGVVLAAVAIELVPKLHRSWSVAIAYIIGAVVLIAINAYSPREKLGFLFASALDLLIDGLLIGVAFAAGQRSGVLITISLSFCAFSLCLALASKMRVLWLFLPVMLPLGALIGSLTIALLPANFLFEILAFGTAALLYLGVEELIDEKDTLWTSSAFFLGFLAILLL